MENNREVTGGGIGFTGVLTIVFIVLKLLKVINWSWVWVLAPTWIPIALALIIMIIGVLMVIIGALIEAFN